MLTKSISIDGVLEKRLKTYAELSKQSSSKVIREALSEFLKRKTKNNLAYKMRIMTPIISYEEQEDIEKSLNNLTADDLEVAEVIEL